MALTSAELRAFINKNFLTEAPVNNIRPEPLADADADPFLPAKTPSMHDAVRSNIKQSATAEYKYLDDVILSNNLVLFPRNLAETYTIHLCLFSINTDLHTPFLQFMFSKTDSVYQFPTTELDMAAIQQSTSTEAIQPKLETEGSVDGDEDDDEYDEASGIDAEFLSQCSDLLQKSVSIPDMDMQSLYRGFLEDDQTANQLYVFFDCTGLNIETHSDKFQTGEYIMAIVDELNAGRINNVEISSDVLQIFNNNPFTKTINMASGEPVPSPMISYLCTKNEDETYANEYYSAETGYDNISLIAPVVTHERFDDIYMFSKTPLTGEYNNIKRFALFYDETEDDVENMDNESEESSEEESVEEGEEESVEEGEEGEEGEEESVEDDDEESGEDDDEESGEDDDEESGEDDDEESGEDDDEESVEEDEEESGEEEEDEESGEEDEEESVEEGEEESGEEDEEESVEEGEEESGEEDEEESGEEGEEESGEEDEEESGEEDEEESGEEEDEESGEEEDEESGEEDEEESGEEDEEESGEEELELAENAVFTFTENEQIYYGTYSLESFTEL